MAKSYAKLPPFHKMHDHDCETYISAAIVAEILGCTKNNFLQRWLNKGKIEPDAMVVTSRYKPPQAMFCPKKIQAFARELDKAGDLRHFKTNSEGRRVYVGPPKAKRVPRI